MTLIRCILFTNLGYNIIIDNEDYDINNPYCYLRRSKKLNDNEDNNIISNGTQLIEPLSINKEELLS